MPKITNIKARQVFDSRGIPTIESEIYLDDGNKASAIVPSGASKGSYEVFELRDIEDKKFLGKSVLKTATPAIKTATKTVTKLGKTATKTATTAAKTATKTATTAAKTATKTATKLGKTGLKTG